MILNLAPVLLPIISIFGIEPNDFGLDMVMETMENTIHLAIWRPLGANPTPMPVSEVFTALKQNVIDGQENPAVAISGHEIACNDEAKYVEDIKSRRAGSRPSPNSAPTRRRSSRARPLRSGFR